MGVLDFLNPQGGPLADISLLNLGSDTDTRLTPEVLNVENLHLYEPQKETATQTVTNGIGDLLGQIMPLLMLFMFMNTMGGMNKGGDN